MSAPDCSSFDAIESTLRELVTDLVTDHAPDPTGPGRPRILPESLLWIGVVVCVLRGWSSQRTVWRLLTLTGLWDHGGAGLRGRWLWE